MDENIGIHSNLTQIILYTPLISSIDLNIFPSAACNPGSLHIKYVNLRHQKAQVINCPSKKAAGKSASGQVTFQYKIGHVSVNMANGEMVVDKVNNIAIHL